MNNLKMRKYFYLSINSFLLCFVFSACQPKEKIEKVEDYHEYSEHEEQIVQLTKEQEETIGLQLGRVEKRMMNTSIDVIGVLDIYSNNRAKVSPLMSGIVQEIKVKEGDFVNKGQTIIVLVNPQIIDEQQRYNQLNSSLTFLQQEYERSKKLFDNDAGSAKTFQKAQAEYRTAKSEFDGLEKKLQLLGFNIESIKNGNLSATILIKSPISGFVNDVHVNLGQFVEERDELVDITDNNQVHADFTIYETDFVKVQKGQLLEFTIAGHPGKVLKAKVESIGQNLEEDKRAILIHANILTPDKHLVPGMYLRGQLLIENQETNVLPRASFISKEGKNFIFIKEGHQYRQIEIETGAENNDFIELKLSDALDTNTEVVVHGAYYLDAELNKSDFEDHDH